MPGRPDMRHVPLMSGVENDPAYAPWPSFQRLIRECILPNWRTLAIGISAMLVLAASAGALPFLLQRAADHVFVAKDPRYLYSIPFAIIALMLVRGVADWVSTVTEGALGAKIVADLRVRMFDTIAAADLGWVQRNHSGHFVSAFFNDAPTVDRAATKVVTGLFKNGASVVFLAGAMFIMDWRLALIVLIAAPLALFNLTAQKFRIKTAVRRQLQNSGDLNAMLTQTLQSMRVVKAYGQEQHETRRFGRLSSNLRKYLMRITRSRATIGPVWELVTGIGIAAALLYGGWQGIYGNVSLGHFTGFMAAAMLAFQPIKSLANTQIMLSEGLLAAGRVFALIDYASDVVEAHDAVPLKVNDASIRFDNVTFAYEDANGPVLRDFSVSIAAGSKVALVGPSGSGKSTVLNLILRFFDPASGSVSISGQDLRQTTIASVRAASALLTQDPVLFDETIAANIAYGSAQATDEDIAAAASAAAAHDFIMRLPGGYQTRVGESGNRFSGGERQRIAFARAMLRDAPILLLDEPTSALDAESEAKVQAAQGRILAGRTVVMIAHRLSTVQRADMICYMESGRILESGTHSELVARRGAYARMVQTQMLGDERTPLAVAGE